jgi:hypothetical protein
MIPIEPSPPNAVRLGVVSNLSHLPLLGLAVRFLILCSVRAIMRSEFSRCLMHFLSNNVAIASSRACGLPWWRHAGCGKECGLVPLAVVDASFHWFKVTRRDSLGVGPSEDFFVEAAIVR